MRAEMMLSVAITASGIKMRVLIVSAFLACATAAPSGLIAPYAPFAYSAVGIPAIVPTIPSGDIQAAIIDANVQARDYTIKAIDAQIQATDLARAANDKAKEITEQVIDNVNARTINTVDQVNEKNVEAFWSAEDKKWQAVDALRTAQAQVDGAVASSASLIAKSTVGVLPYVAVASAPIIAPISPIAYPGIVAPIAGDNSANEQIEAAAKTVESTAENIEAAAKTVESTAETSENKAEKVEGVAVVKTVESEALAKAEGWTQPLVAPVGITSVYRYDVVAPGVAPIIAQPWVKYAGAHQLQAVAAPTLIKTVW